MRTALSSLVIGLVLLIGGLFTGAKATAGEVRFVAADVVEGRAIWEPSVAMIDQSTDLKGGLVFILENASKFEHAFAVEGLYELVLEKERGHVDVGVEIEAMNYTLKPIRVAVAPKETKRIAINTAELESARNLGKRFRYFCPIHKDVHLAGSIYVVD